jgi:hypothetical protein
MGLSLGMRIEELPDRSEIDRLRDRELRAMRHRVHKKLSRDGPPPGDATATW